MSFAPGTGLRGTHFGKGKAIKGTFGKRDAKTVERIVQSKRQGKIAVTLPVLKCLEGGDDAIRNT